jgi:5-methyltetrahydropteroyltriglutamate--homocysteine methyltransferase
MIDYFVRPLGGVSSQLTTQQLATWREQHEMDFRSRPPGVVVGPLTEGRLNLAADYALYRDLTGSPKKFTVTSPYMLARTLADTYYHDQQALVMALADILKQQLRRIDADVIQVDEAHVTGHAEDGLVAAAGINRVLEGISGEAAVHLCYGNYGGQPIQRGTYEQLIVFLNALEADHVVLEVARRPENELKILKEVKSSLALGIGVIDIKDNEVETPQRVARRIERAARELGTERIKYVHPDCGFWMLPRSVADAKMAALVAGRNLFEGRGVSND